jgi:hypothetical protein
MKGGMPDHDQAGRRDDLLDVLILPIPTLDLVGGRLPDSPETSSPGLSSGQF